MKEIYLVVWEGGGATQTTWDIQGAFEKLDDAKELLAGVALNIISYWDAEFENTEYDIASETQDCFYIKDKFSCVYDKVFIINTNLN